MLLCLAAPAAGQVHAKCQGAPPTGTAPLVVIDTAVSLAFEYADADWAGVTQGNILVHAAAAAATVPPLSTQVVMKSTITRLGPGNLAGDGCYSLPVVPVAQIPRGVPIQFKLTVTGGEPALASAPSNPTNPLGQRFQAAVLRATTP